MFRASPWVTYDPSADHRNQNPARSTPPPPSKPTDDSADMDAPLISTLREEESPPPPAANPSRTSKFRVKLLVNDGKKSRSASVPSVRKQSQAPEEDEEQDEEEEDQLIDDEDVRAKSASGGAASSSAAPRQADTAPKRKPSPKKRPKKGEPKLEEEKKKATAAEAVPSAEPSLAGASSSAPDPQAGKQPNKKRSAPKKAPAKPKAKTIKATKNPANPALPLFEDSITESYPATATSSPVTVPLEIDTPEPDRVLTPLLQPQTVEENTIEPIALPVYPLPSKPFPVQPAPKYSQSGFAPVIALDMCQEKARHWRIANREIRGIAGGRWFAHTWVGDKESEYASHLTAKAAAAENEKQGTPGAASTPSKTSTSGPSSGKGKGRSVKSRSAPSLSASAAPSRSGSVNPELHMPHATRSPTKMRTFLAPTSDGENDVEMTLVEPVDS